MGETTKPKAPLRPMPRWVVVAAVLFGIVSPVVFCCVLMAGLFALSFGPRFASFPLPAPDATFHYDVALAAGRRVQLSLHDASDSTDGCNGMRVHVELMQRGTPALAESYDGFDFDVSADAVSSPLGETATLATVTVPAGGVDAIEASYALLPLGCHAQLDGLVIELRDPRF